MRLGRGLGIRPPGHTGGGAGQAALLVAPLRCSYLLSFGEKPSWVSVAQPMASLSLSPCIFSCKGQERKIIVLDAEQWTHHCGDLFN